MGAQWRCDPRELRILRYAVSRRPAGSIHDHTQQCPGSVVRHGPLEFWRFHDADHNRAYSATHTYAQALSSAFVSATISNSLGTGFANLCCITVANGIFSFPQQQAAFVENSGAAHVQVQRSTATGTVSVNYSTGNISAIAGYRYTATSGTLTFNDGETLKTIDIPLIDNANFDGDQSFSVSLSNPTNGYLVSSPQFLVTIRDDELPPTLAFSSPTYHASEKDGSIIITVLRSGDLTRTVAVSYSSNSFSSTPVLGSVAGTLIFAPQETTKTFTVPIIDNDIYDGDQTTTLTLFNPSGGAVFPGSNFNATAQLTVADDEPRPTFNVDDIAVVEGDSGTKTANFTISITGKFRNSIFFSTAIAPGTATFGVDFTLPFSQPAIAAGATSTTFPIVITGDTTVEANETAIVQVSASSCCSIVTPLPGKRSGVCTIINDDSGISPSHQRIAVGGRGTFLLSVGPPSATPQVVTIVSSNPSAIEVPPSVTITDTSSPATFQVLAKKGESAIVTVLLPAAFGGRTLTATVDTFDPMEIRFEPSEVSVGVGETRQVVAHAVPPIDVPATLSLTAADPTRVLVPPSLTLDATGTGMFTVTGVKAGATAVSTNVGAAHDNRNYFLLVDVATTPTVPALSAITPASGPSSGGSAVTVNGFNLRADCSIAFGADTVPVVLESDGTLSATTPHHAPGVVDVTLTCGDQTSTLANAFTFIDASPTLSTVTPSFGSVDGGTFVRLRGANFRSGCWPFFDGTPADQVTFVDTTALLATTPPHPAGAAIVALRCSGEPTASMAAGFSFTEKPDPSAFITSVNPLFGAPGQTVAVQGVGLRPTDRVTIGDRPATILAAAPESHSVRIPDLPAGTVSIDIVNGDSAVSTAGPIFTVTEPRPPQISSVTPVSVTAGAELQLFGTDFRPAYGLMIGGAPLSILELSSDRVVARVPSLAAGSYNVNVINAAGNIAAIGPAVVVTATGLKIVSISPGCTTTDGGTAIVLTGTRFQSGATVTFGGVPASNAVVMDAATISATTPSLPAGEVTIEVRNPDGDSTTLTGSFNVFSPFDPHGCAVRSRPAHH